MKEKLKIRYHWHAHLFFIALPEFVGNMALGFMYIIFGASNCDNSIRVQCRHLLHTKNKNIAHKFIDFRQGWQKAGQ